MQLDGYANTARSNKRLVKLALKRREAYPLTAATLPKLVPIIQIDVCKALPPVELLLACSGLVMCVCAHLETLTPSHYCSPPSMQ